MKIMHNEKEKETQQKVEQKNRDKQNDRAVAVPDSGRTSNETLQADDAKAGKTGDLSSNKATHGSQSAYAEGSERMYQQFQESFGQTGDLNHPETQKKEQDYKGTLGISGLREYYDMKSEKESSGQAVAVPAANTQSQDPPVSRLITVRKGQRFNNKIIANQDDLNRFAESEMGITRQLNWNKVLSDAEVQAMVANGGTVWYTINVKSNDIQEEAKSLSEDRKGFIKDAGNSADYIQNLRILDLLKQLSDEEIADYKSKVYTETNDPAAIEASLKAYIESVKQRRKEQDEHESVKTKLYGLEALYEQYIRFSKTSASTTYTATGGIPVTVVNTEYESDKQKLTNDLIANGFKGGIAEFKKFIESYENGFESKTAQIGIDYLQQYKHFLFEEQKKLSNEAYLEKLLSQLKATGAKQKFDAADRAKSSASVLHYADKPSAQERSFQMEMKAEADQKQAEAENNIADFTNLTPLVIDEGFDSEGFANCSSTAEIKSFLQSYILEKNEKANDAIDKIRNNPEHVYELDKLFETARQQEHIEDGSIYDRILKAKYEEIHKYDVLKAVGLGILALAIIVVTWGAATPVVVAGGIISTGISIGLAYEAIDEYKTKKGFHDVGLLSEDPSVAWVVIAIAGAALDAGALAAVLRSAKPITLAAKAFNDAEDAASALKKLGDDLAKIEGLHKKVQENILKQARIKAQEQKIMASFAQTRGMALSSLPLLVQTGELLARAVFAIRKGIVTFDSFIAELRLAKVISDASLSPEDLVSIKEAFGKAKAFGNNEVLAADLGKILEEGNSAKLKEFLDFSDEFFRINWDHKSDKTFGHAFLRHGKKRFTNLIDRANTLKIPQGVWMDDAKAAELIKQNWRNFVVGENIIDIPPGLGKVILPDGRVIENVIKAVVVKNPKGATNLINTAYPKIIE
ncbi:hypothetical protein [Flavobacterium cerinum]|uniref:Bacterial toxin 46 domain-containing protein n=1 Tax=Flavobacterium cerinum TaxID=2502784 RepID=A0ABY5IWE8_9FLAO|nr:hypothetical protein [Flavobacterium cerinum]UUC47161.1 hypothetical protein NOX80_08170 [Flavobacterium cerinum]